MNYYYITGTSRGLGKAFAEFLLKEECNFVFGIARTCTIKHKNYKHFTLDLSDTEKAQSFNFDLHKDAQKIYLINNAGALGSIAHVGNQSASSIVNTINLNLTAPLLLTNNFIAKYSGIDCEKVVINISSGAGKNTYDGWGTYCTTKAGIDIYSRVVDVEQQLKAKGRVRIFSIAPGVVDTQMQEDIRKAENKEFSKVADFINYKKTGQLLNPDLLAINFLRIFKEVTALDRTVFSIKDYTVN